MPTEYVSALVGAIASIVIGAAVYLGQQRYARWSAAMDIIAEFNTLEWLALRNRLHEDVSLAPRLAVLGAVPTELDDEAREQRARAWALIAFYARLSVMFDGQFLARKPVFMALGEVFAWWYEFDLKYPSPVSDSSEMAHIHRLHDLFGTEARKQHKMPAYREWLGRGQRARAALGLPVKRQKDL